MEDIKEKMDLYVKKTVAELWKSLEDCSSHVDIFCILQCLASELNRINLSSLFPDGCDKCLINLLNYREYPEVLIMACVLVAKLCQKTSVTKKGLIHSGIISKLADLLRDCIYPSVLNNSNGMQSGIRPIFIDLTMKVLTLLSYFSLEYPLHVTEEHKLVAQLLELLNWQNSYFFPVIPEIRARTENLIKDKNIMATVADLELKAKQKFLNTFFHNDLPEILESINGKLLSDFDLDVTGSRCLNELKQSVHVLETGHLPKTLTHAEQINIEIKSIIGPCQYWAWIDAGKTRAKVNEIQKALTKLLTQDRVCTDRPHPGQIIVVGDDKKVRPYRACVLPPSSGALRVFALDYGFVTDIQTKWIFTTDLHARNVPPQATYCEVKGLVTSPLSFPLMEAVLEILCNITSLNTKTCHFGGSDDDGDDILTLLTWALCSNHNIQVKALQILSNIARNDLMSEKLGRTGVIELMLDLIQRQRHQLGDNVVQNVVDKTLSLLANLLYKSPSNKERFFRAEGIELFISEFISDEIPSVRLHERSLQVLRNFIGHCQLSNYIATCGLSLPDHQPVHSDHMIMTSPEKNSVNEPEDQQVPICFSKTASQEESELNERMTESAIIHQHYSECDSDKEHQRDFVHGDARTSASASSKTQSRKEEGMHYWCLGRGQRISPSVKPRCKNKAVSHCGYSDDEKTTNTSAERKHNTGSSSSVSSPGEVNQDQDSDGQQQSKQTGFQSAEHALRLAVRTQQEPNSTATNLHSPKQSGISTETAKGITNASPVSTKNATSPTESGSSLSIPCDTEDPHQNLLPSVNPDLNKETVDEQRQGNMTSRTCLDEDTTDILKHRSDSRRKYIKGDQVFFRTDQTHEIISAQCVNDIKKEAFQKTFISFLNSGKGGTMYYGIHHRYVIGLCFDHDERDAFLMGCGEIVMSIKPPVHPSLYNVRFVPIFEETTTAEPIKDQFVVEVLIKPQDVMLFSVDEEVYLRDEGQIFVASPQDINRKAVEDEEKRHLFVLSFLQHQIRAIKHRIDEHQNCRNVDQYTQHEGI